MSIVLQVKKEELMEEIKNTETTVSAKRDTSMDLRVLVSKPKEAPVSEEPPVSYNTIGPAIASPVTGYASGATTSGVITESTYAVRKDVATTEQERPQVQVKEQPLTPLQQAIKEQQTAETGFKVEEEKPTEPLRSIIDSDESREAFKNTVNDQKEMIEKEKLIVVLQKPTHQLEMAALMDEISRVEIGSDGKAIIPPDCTRIITKEEAIQRKLKELEENKNNPDYEGSVDDVHDFYTEKKLEEKDKIVKILIDKTGLGANITFDDEENKAIMHASEIHLVEVETEELQVVDFDRADDGVPFMQAIDTYNLSTSKVPMIFPASGFTADMAGMSFAEYAAITLDMRPESEDYLNFDVMNRKLYTIYTKMQNVSIGAFKDYDDFLRKFAYQDIAMATYGLLIATQPEIDSLVLTCNAKECGKHFNFKYVPRDIIDWTTASTFFLERVKAISELAPEEKVAFAEKCRKIRRIKLNRSGYMVDFGMASCYDYLYGILGIFKKFEEIEMDERDARYEIIQFIYSIRAILIPQKDGRMVRFTDPEQIIDILAKSIPTEDMKIIAAASEQYIQQFTVGFAFKDVECPYCHHMTKTAPILPDELVFLIQQRQLSTEVIVDNFQTL